MSEEWIKWEPLKELPSQYYIDSVSDTRKAFCIVLSDSNDSKNQIKFIFEGPVDSYRKTEETFTFSILDHIHKKYGAGFYNKNSFFKIVNSLDIRALSEQSYGIAESRNLTHYVFWGLDSLVDVISASQPNIEFITNN